jgi:prophage regulatory protein
MAELRSSIQKVRAAGTRPRTTACCRRQLGAQPVDRAMSVPTSEHDHKSTVEPVAGGPLRFIRFTAVRDRTGLSRSTIWRLERRGAFPKHKRLSTNAVGWLEQEVDQWVRSRSATE